MLDGERNRFDTELIPAAAALLVEGEGDGWHSLARHGAACVNLRGDVCSARHRAELAACGGECSNERNAFEARRR